MLQRHSTGLAFAFDPARLGGRIVQKASGAAWAIDLTAARGVACGAPEPMHAEFPWTQKSRALERLRPLRPRDLRRTRELEDGVELDFHVGGAEFRIALRLGLEPDEFVFTLQPLVSGQADLLAAELPGPIMPDTGAHPPASAGGSGGSIGDGIQVLSAYRHQGRLFTGKPGEMEPEASSSSRRGAAWAASALGAVTPGVPAVSELNMSEGRYRMRFFGVLGDTERPGSARAGYLAIIDENADARIILRQAEDGRLACSVAWAPSMGTMAYTRTIRYRFADRPTVTSLAKGFRRYAMSAGMFKSLKDKIAERPVVGKLVGATACFLGYEACSLDYAGTFKQLRAMGHTAFYAFPLYHVNCAFGDSFAGMKLIDIRDQTTALRALGAITGSWTYLAGIANKPEVLRLAARNADGTMPLNWRIGDDLWPQMCQGQAEQFLAGQAETLMQADGHHFDTTASNSLMECYAPAHPLDRRGDRAARMRLLDQTAALGRFVASEGVKDWAVPHYDMGSNKEIPLKAETPAFRVVPLQHLVYHDAIYSLWWECHPYDCSHFGIGGDPLNQSLTDLLYGDMPLIFPVGRQYRWAGQGMEAGAVEFEQTLDLPLCRQSAERAVTVARHFGRVATEELTDFAFLTDDGAVQQTQFANGVSVIANFGAHPYPAPNGAPVLPLAAICL